MFKRKCELEVLCFNHLFDNRGAVAQMVERSLCM